MVIMQLGLVMVDPVMVGSNHTNPLSQKLKFVGKDFADASDANLDLINRHIT